VEPPKQYWFIMGEYLPPPLGILALASYLETRNRDVTIEVIDSQAEEIGWEGLQKRIESFQPDVVAPSGLATCNAYAILRTAEIAKKVSPSTITIVGGQHYTALAKESLEVYHNLDIVVRGEGEQTLSELVKILTEKKPLSEVSGISFRHKNRIVSTPDRELISNLDSLPFPGYHFVRDHMQKYYFTLMTRKDTPYAVVEGSRGCHHDCSYCSQWRFWRRKHRSKSPKRIVDEIKYLRDMYGTRFFWLADDNFTLGQRASKLCDEIIARGIAEDVTWFCQARCDNVVRHKDLLPKMRKAGNIWMLTGLDSPDPETIKAFRREGIDRSNAKEAVDLLRQNDIFSQGMFIIGERRDSHESIEALREYADWLDPDIATFMTLTPFPGTEIYENARCSGWIEDTNWSNYDMIHAIMPTEHLTREEVQEELYECYRSFFGKWKRRYQGFFSKNEVTRRTYQFLAREAILTGLKSLF
ncbi:MAG: radical SAM protein, partial [Candidatus Bathyarchaeota archaeon]|nr:radical SAM protein [Candidatus Bathyarchaeota archaeon]